MSIPIIQGQIEENVPRVISPSTNPYFVISCWIVETIVMNMYVFMDIQNQNIGTVVQRVIREIVMRDVDEVDAINPYQVILCNVV